MNFHGGNVYKYDKGIIDFSSNINPLGVPDSFREALFAGIEEFTKYPEIDYIRLRQAVGEYLSISCIDYIAVGNGAVELIYKAVHQSGKKKLISLKPTFSEYSRAAVKKGIEYIAVNAMQSDFGSIDADIILKHADRDSAVIICNPNNPTGTLVEKEKLLYIAKELQAKGALFIIDEAFMEFAEDYPSCSMLRHIDEYKNLIVIKAATKFFGMPGIRLGYAVGSNLDLIKAIREGMEPWNVNTAAVIAGCTVLKDKAYIDKSREWISKERQFMYKELEEIAKLKVYPSAANFHLICILKEHMNAWQLKENLLEKNILIRTPEGFEELDGSYVRLAIKSREENILLLNALKDALI